MSPSSAAGLSSALFYAGLGLLVFGALRLVNRAEGPWGLALLTLGALAVGSGIAVALRTRGAKQSPGP